MDEASGFFAAERRSNHCLNSRCVDGSSLLRLGRFVSRGRLTLLFRLSMARHDKAFVTAVWNWRCDLTVEKRLVHRSRGTTSGRSPAAKGGTSS